MMRTPNHCRGDGRSAKNSTARRIVQSGPVARIGEATESGRDLSPRYPKIQEETKVFHGLDQRKPLSE